MQFWSPYDEHMCSKHVEAWNKLIVKQKFCASSWLITEINILRSTVSKTSKFVMQYVYEKDFVFCNKIVFFWGGGLCSLLCSTNYFPYISLKYEWIFLTWLKDAVPVLRSVPRNRLLYPGTEQLGSGTVPGRSAKLRFTTGLRHIRGFRLEDFRLSSFWTELSFPLSRCTLFVFVCNTEEKSG